MSSRHLPTIAYHKWMFCKINTDWTPHSCFFLLLVMSSWINVIFNHFSHEKSFVLVKIKIFRSIFCEILTIKKNWYRYKKREKKLRCLSAKERGLEESQLVGTYLGKQTNAKKILTEKMKPKLILTEIFICFGFSIPLLNYISAWRIFQSFINFKCVSISFNIHFNTLFSCHLFHCFLFLSFIIRFIFHLSISLCNLFESASWHAHDKKFQWLFLNLGKPPWLAKLYWLWFSTQICNINFSDLRHSL
jgi:hypothetical protein